MKRVFAWAAAHLVAACYLLALALVFLLVEMIYFLDMGFDEDSLVEYYRNQSNQVNILIKVRNNMLKQLHESQKKLDSVDYLINHK